MALRRFLEADHLSCKYEPYFGCDAGFLRAFIEHQFNGQMHWSNFGTVWKIGHILSPHVFDQTKEEDVKLCWNWINLCPVFGIASRRGLSGVEAICILEWRQRFFMDNLAISELLIRAKAMATEENKTLVDWSMFHVEN